MRNSSRGIPTSKKFLYGGSDIKQRFEGMLKTGWSGETLYDMRIVCEGDTLLWDFKQEQFP